MNADADRANRVDRASYTLFSVTKEDRHSRSDRIREFFLNQPALGYLLAVFDFEWTVRRAIFLVSKCPIAVIKQCFDSKCYPGWAAYRGCWTKYVQNTQDERVHNLEQIVFDRKLNESVSKDELLFMQNAMDLRHKLVHGISGSIPSAKADSCFELILTASERITAFVEDKIKKPMFARAHRPMAGCKQCARKNRCRFPKERKAAQETAEIRRQERLAKTLRS